MRTSTTIAILSAFCFAAAVALWLHEPHDYMLNVPADYSTIEEAVAAAEYADQVMVAPGSYTANLQWVGKDLTILGSGSDSTVVTFTDFFVGKHKDEAGRPTTPVHVELHGMTITSSNLLLSDTTTVQDAVITRSTVKMTGVVGLHNVLLHHNDVYVHGARETWGGRESTVTMTNVTLWDNSRFFFEGKNALTAEWSILQEWSATISGMTNDRDLTSFHMRESYTANPLYNRVADNCWVPKFRNAARGDYTLCASPPIGPIGAQLF